MPSRSGRLRRSGPNALGLPMFAGEQCVERQAGSDCENLGAGLPAAVSLSTAVPANPSDSERVQGVSRRAGCRRVRTRAVSPDQTRIGAVPLNRAKAAVERKRETGRSRRARVAAPSTPWPQTPEGRAAVLIRSSWHLSDQLCRLSG